MNKQPFSILFSLFVCTIFLAGCATAPSMTDNSKVSKTKTEKEMLSSSFFDRLPDGGAEQQQQRPLKPVFKNLSPLKTEHISISFSDEDYHHVFQALAKASGLNLALDPSLDSSLGSRSITAEFQENSIESVLNAVCDILNVNWKEEHSTLFINPWSSKTFDLDFIPSAHQSSFNVGGDVLGSGSGNSSSSSGSSSNSGSSGNSDINSPLAGEYRVNGKLGADVTDIYTTLEESLGKIVNAEGEFLLNRQTGTLFIRCRPQRMKQVEEFLDRLREKYTRQVLIEAQIMEVTLNQSTQLGIDWQQLALEASHGILNSTVTDKIYDLNGTTKGDDSFYTLSITADKYNLSGVFRALRQFGNVKMLSNPHLKALNGQPALISVGQSVAYLKSLEQTREVDNGVVTITVNTDIGSLFDGILLGVTPVIKKDGSVSLHIVPIKSEIASLEQQDLADGEYTITLPQVNLRELSTVVDVKPGHLVLLGGLIMDKEEDVTTEVPILADLPFIGNAFRQKNKVKEKVEMVIILRLKVL